MQSIIPVTSAIRDILSWWTLPHQWDPTVSLEPFEAQLHLFTDASTFGWGAHMGLHNTAGIWNYVERMEHINVLECVAVLRALIKFKLFVQNKSVLLSTDNATTMSYINRQGGTKSLDMFNTTHQILMWCHTVNTEWSLHPTVTQDLWNLWIQPDIDLFTTIYNRKLKRYVSPFPDEEAVTIDAM